MNFLQKAVYNEETMQALLDEDDVKENVDKMTPAELKFFKQTLMRQGVGKRPALERQKEAWKDIKDKK